MIVIRITLEDGKSFFVNEKNYKIESVQKITEAFEYQNILEFKVSWKSLRNFYRVFDSEVKKFEAIDIDSDIYPYGIYEFDINDNYKLDETIYVDSTTFRKLIKYPIDSWYYDKDDNWVAFLKENEYDIVYKMIYYKRGLTNIIYWENGSCWFDRYNRDKWHNCVREYVDCEFLLSTFVQKLYVSDYDECHRFTIYENSK